MKLTHEQLLCISEFAKLTGVIPKDCIIGEKILSFLVEKKQLGKAIGRRARNLRKLEEKTKKRVEVIALTQDIKDFIREALKAEPKKLEKNGKRITVTFSPEDRIKIMKKTAKLKRIKLFAERNFGVVLLFRY
ncbi:MAG: hypothetical protein J7L14_02625 [Candidatus Diapherotrites archaeon]|nr:hypothetical protein [Candidatus Diapherotrites archaeon]